MRSVVVRVLAGVGCCLTVMSCSNTATVTVDVGPPAQIAVNAGNNQTAPMGTAVAISPSVIVTDKHGSPTPDVTVTFTPAPGGDSVTQDLGYGPTEAVTGPDGIATSDAWILGCSATNNLRVTMKSYSGVAGDPVTFTAFGTPHECWDAKASIPTPRRQLGVGVVNGVLYAVGGTNTYTSINYLTTVEAYVPATDTWIAKASMPTARYDLGVGTIDGTLYAVGGASANGPRDATVEAYNPMTDTWTAKTPMRTQRAGLGVGTINGVLYVVGGCHSTPCPVEAYDPTTNTWTTKAAMPTSRFDFGVGVVNGIVYAVGGIACTSECSISASVEAYDPATDTWTTKASMPTARAEPGIGVINGILYVVGGSDASGQILATVEAYDPMIDTWTTHASMPTARQGLGVGAINGILYAVSGDRGHLTGRLALAHEAYHPQPPAP